MRQLTSYEKKARPRPFVKIPEQHLEVELLHASEVDRVRVGGPLGINSRAARTREREHRAED